MKRLKVCLPLIFLAIHTLAQDIDNGKKHYYYKRYNSAEQFFHEYLRQQPQSGEGWLWLAKSYVQEQKPDKLNDSLSKAQADVQEDPYFLVAKGLQSLVNKQTDASRGYFEKAIDITKGKKPEIFSAIAETQLLSKDGNLD